MHTKRQSTPYALKLVCMLACVSALADKLYSRKSLTRSEVVPEESPNKRLSLPAEAYLDELLANHNLARAFLCGKFEKRSRTAVAYMCEDRGDHYLSSVFQSEGLQKYDVFISQNGGKGYPLDVTLPTNAAHVLRLLHPIELCSDLRLFFVKTFVFDIMHYDNLIIVDDSSVLHPQDLSMLSNLLELSADNPQIGLVALSGHTDALKVLPGYESRFPSGVRQAAVAAGPLHVYGMSASRYRAVQQNLNEYYNVIKGYDCNGEYHTAHSDLHSKLVQLFESKGFAAGVSESLESFFLNSLLKAGYVWRLASPTRPPMSEDFKVVQL